VYEKIGGVFPDLRGMEENTAELGQIYNILALLYADVLEFHSRALVVFKRKCDVPILS
jgi:hypothetical protein